MYMHMVMGIMDVRVQEAINRRWRHCNRANALIEGIPSLQTVATGRAIGVRGGMVSGASENMWQWHGGDAKNYTKPSNFRLPED